jgi:Protein of unknown function (DUF3768)
MVEYCKRNQRRVVLSGPARIAQLNDDFRRNFTGGHITQAVGVRILKRDMRMKVMEAVRNFTAFPPEPDHEHDYAPFEVEGQKFIWQIDTYDLTLSQESEDPTDTTKTIRVLTVYTEAEYYA